MQGRKYDLRSYPGFIQLTVLCLLILYLPLIVVGFYSFNASPSIVLWEGFSWRWYVDVHCHCDVLRNRDDQRGAVSASNRFFWIDLFAPYGAGNRNGGSNTDFFQFN